MKFWLLGYLVAFLSSLALTAWARQQALRKAILDIPNERSSHTIPTPRGGGFGFVVVFYIGLVVLWLTHQIDARLALALCGGVPLAYVGHLDDKHGLSARWRFGVQLLVAIWGVAWLGGVPVFDWGCGQWPVPVIGSILAVIATVWLINLYNFMDGIDGIAGLEGIFVLGTAGVVMAYVGSPLAGVAGLLVAGLAGFLVWNWPPAKIFMGDIGSGFIGYIIALLLFSSNNAHTLPIPFWIIVLALFMFDAFYTLMARLLRKEKVYEAHREHAYQRLVQKGFKHWQVTVGEGVVNILLALPLALLYLTATRVEYALLIIAITVVLSFAAWRVISSRGNCSPLP